jgi:hypothetical protein
MSTEKNTQSSDSAEEVKACLERTQELFKNNFKYLVNTHCPNAAQAINAAAILTATVMIDMNRIQRLKENRHE